MAEAGPARHSARPRRVRLLAAVVAVGVAGGVLAVHLGGDGPTTAALSGNASKTVPLLGSSVLSDTDLGRATTRFGRMPIVRVYYPSLPGPWAWTDIAARNRSAVIVSFKARPRAILSGADDARLRRFFATAPRGRPVYYSYFHEPEDNIERGQFTAAAYRAAWKHVVRLADAAHNRYLHSTLILMSYDLVRAARRHWKDYLPRGGTISVLGWDAYPVGSATNDHPRPTAPAVFMGPAIAASRSVGLPYGFAEFGLSTRHGRPAWLAKVGKYLLHSGALFGCLFNGNGQYPTLRLTDSASAAVWRYYVHKSAAARRRGLAPVPGAR
jgi:hypothetical protein